MIATVAPQCVSWNKDNLKKKLLTQEENPTPKKMHSFIFRIWLKKKNYLHPFSFVVRQSFEVAPNSTTITHSVLILQCSGNYTGYFYTGFPILADLTLLHGK